MLNIYPNFLDNSNFKHVILDKKYICTIQIVEYPVELEFLEFINSMPKDISYRMSIFLEKQDTNKVLKEITYNISNFKSEIKTSSNNQIDIDVLNRINNDAKKIRYEIQINNEEIYKIYSYLTITSLDEFKLNLTINKIRNMLYSKMYKSNLLNFRHLQGYLSSNPINYLDESLSKSCYKNMTNSNVVNLFPFYTNTIFDKNGSIFGHTTGKNICSINVFDKKYNNSNICIFGSSGSGKSYFTKLLILRHYITNTRQYIFDPEGEYSIIPNAINVDFSFHKFNILDIKKSDILKSNYLDSKIEYIYEFLSENIDLKDCETDIKIIIKDTYFKKGITDDLNSIYNEDNIYLNKKIKDSSYMPILEDIYMNMKLYTSKQNKKLKTQIVSFKQLLDRYGFLNGKTTFDFEGDITIFNISKLEKEKRNVIFKILLENIIEFIKVSKVNNLIYIDEVWKFIYNNEKLSEKIFELFKTVRKLNAGIIVITQDISDFFTKDSGMYGKSIMNNSFIKMFFKMEYSDIDVLNKIGIFAQNEIINMHKLNKGSALMSFQGNIVQLDIKSNEYESKIIEGES